MIQDECYDITIIGGGPTGLFTAFYGGMRQMKVKILESMPQLGGQLSALYPEKYIYDVAGFPKVRAQDLVEDLKEQAMQFSPTVSLGQSVDKVERLEDKTFLLTTDKGEKHLTKAIIITAGVGAFQPRPLKISNANDYENKNLFYFVKDLNQFSGKKAIVCGGGDSAVDWANMLEPIASEVTLIHRRDKFRAHENSVEQLKNSSVKIRNPYNVRELIGSEEKINKVIIEHVKDKTSEEVEIDAILVNYGFASSLGPIQEWELDIKKNSIVVDSKMETNIEGIYAVGDIATYEGKVKLIATGFGEAPVAVSNAKKYIDPSARVQPLHSTSVMADKGKKSELVNT
ncbi:NAD(P)/FAD-dependent oxidoreductase [Halobacillus naozhouensis]|uniref:Ferredoxin--NADP reductase n=1 Tax=Halobacillus naozhouensis TaxID=554880 RepID=A0ABY8J2I6_9BACI|nr:NAD(P)/FAD-dependent oxidoreductase [Halobacillus naozhouensis]WFT75608.1 NAD(P)/FAD-dependent oxidoreductase [Halobacillus naozhouensis]